MRHRGALIRILKLDQSLVTIGRGGTNDIVLSGTRVSRDHAKVYQVNSTYYYRDLQTKNRSRHSGRWLSGPLIIRDGVVIEIEGYTLTFRWVDLSEFPKADMDDDRTRELSRSALLNPPTAPGNDLETTWVGTDSESVAAPTRVQPAHPTILRNVDIIVDVASSENPQPNADSTINEELYQDEIHETFLQELTGLSPNPPGDERTRLSNPLGSREPSNPPREPSVTEKEEPDSFMKLLGLKSESVDPGSRPPNPESTPSPINEESTHQPGSINLEAFGETEDPFPMKEGYRTATLDSTESAQNLALSTEEAQIPEFEMIQVPEDPSITPRPEGFESAPPSTGDGERTILFTYPDNTPAAQLYVVEGAMAHRQYALSKDENWIGRAESCEVVTPHLNCSRRHAVIRKVGTDYVIFDNHATNGIRVNGVPVATHSLRNHDIVQISDISFEFCLPGVSPNGRIPRAISMDPPATLLATTYKTAGGQAIFPAGFLAMWADPKKRIRLIAAAGVLLLTGYLLFRKPSVNVRKVVEQKAEQIVLTEWTKLAREIRYDYASNGIDIADLKPDTLREDTLRRLESSAHGTLLVPMLERLFSVNPEEFKSLLLHPEKAETLLAKYKGEGVAQSPPVPIDSAAKPPPTDSQELDRLVTLARQSMRDTRWEDAVGFAESALKLSPDNIDLQTLRDQAIQERNKASTKDEITRLIGREEVLKERSIKQLVERAQERLKSGEINLALDDLAEALSIDPNSSDALQLKQLIESERQKAKAPPPRSEERNQAANVVFERAREHNDKGETEEAYKLIRLIIEKYRDSSLYDVAVESEASLREALEIKYADRVANARMAFEEQNYAEAWKAIHGVLDKFAAHTGALELKREMEKKTELEVRKFFNMGRVYEEEANDYESALSEYERVLTIANPRGDTYKKAKKRKTEIEQLRIRRDIEEDF